MIERIREIKNIGTYESSGNGAILLKPFTFIYAANTYGKTTFCDILRSFKTNDISYINCRRRIGAKGTDKCIVKFTLNNKNVNFDGDKWIVPDEGEERKNIEIFDINFVNENVFTNFNIEHKNKEKLTSFILGERSVELINQLNRQEELLTEKQNLYNDKKIELEKLLVPFTFDQIRRLKYNEDFKDYECLLNSALEAIKSYKDQSREIDSIKKIATIKQLVVDFEPIKKIIMQAKDLCEYKYDIDLSKLSAEFDELVKDIPNMSDAWIKEGIKLKTQKCPFCGTDISNNERIKIFSEYFSEMVILFLDQTESVKKIIYKVVKTPNIVNSLNDISQQKKMIAKYYKDEQTDLIDSLLEEISNKNQVINIEIEKVRDELEENLDRKLKSFMKTCFSFDYSDSLLKMMKEFDSIITNLNQYISNYNFGFVSFQNKLSNEFYQEKIGVLQTEYNHNNIIFLRGTYNEQINSLIQTDEHINQLHSKIKESRKVIDMQEEEFLGKYFAKIQEIYSKLGGENYHLKRESTARGKKKVYGIEIYFKGQLIDETRYCLSESDRRALALSIFLSKIQVDNNSNVTLVLDDPVTSFDQDRMRSFISILNNLMHICCCQVIVLMHYENFFRLITKTFEDKTLIKINRDKDNHIFEEINENNDIFKDDYDKKLSNIIKFINAETNSINENDVRIFFENYLKRYYAYEIVNKASIKGGTLHEFVINLERERLISNVCKDDLLLKLKFLNDSSHSFTDYSVEEQRSFVKEAYISLHEIRK